MKLISIASVLLVVVAAASVVDAQHNTGDGGVKWLPNCDYIDGDLQQHQGALRIPVEECGRACINRRRCNHFTYKDGECILKRHNQSFGRTPCSSCDVCGFLPWRQGPDGIKQTLTAPGGGK